MTTSFFWELSRQPITFRFSTYLVLDQNSATPVNIRIARQMVVHHGFWSFDPSASGNQCNNTLNATVISTSRESSWWAPEEALLQDWMAPLPFQSQALMSTAIGRHKGRTWSLRWEKLWPWTPWNDVRKTRKESGLPQKCLEHKVQVPSQKLRPISFEQKQLAS